MKRDIIRFTIEVPVPENRAVSDRRMSRMVNQLLTAVEGMTDWGEPIDADGVSIEAEHVGLRHFAQRHAFRRTRRRKALRK